MKFLCKYGSQFWDDEDEVIVVESNSAEQVKRYVYDFVFELHLYSNEDRSSVHCSIIEFNHENEEHMEVLKTQDGIFWEV